MYKIEIFRNDRYKVAEFTFSTIAPEYNPAGEWIVIKTSGHQIITLNEVPTLMYDENIESISILAEYGEWKAALSRNYARGKKSLVVFNEQGYPLRQFCGYSLQLVDRSNGLDHFVVDDRNIWLYQMKFMILTKDDE